MGNVCFVKDPDEDDYDRESDIDSTTINRDYFQKHPGINDKFPNLTGSTQDTDDFDLYEHADGSWIMIFMHAGDFTPVCTTELADIAENQQEFKNRNVKTIGFSCNDSQSHKKWIKDIKVATGQTINFPIFCDSDRSNSTWLGVIDERSRNNEGLPSTVRYVYLIDPHMTISFVVSYPASTGSNTKELLRTIDSVQLAYDYSVATPVNWVKGEKVLVDMDLSDKAAEQKFGKEAIETITVPSEERNDNLETHYMRFVNDPMVR
jgi:alkyl hydroperoxide reductase subunit AhpC